MFAQLSWLTTVWLIWKLASFFMISFAGVYEEDEKSRCWQHLMLQVGKIFFRAIDPYCIVNALAHKYLHLNRTAKAMLHIVLANMKSMCLK
jgi:hypothetical protein